MAESQGSIDIARAGVAVAALTGLGAFGPAMGLSAAWIVVLVGGVLVALSVDAATWQGMGGHLLAETLPGGESRLRRIAVHEAGHVLIAQTEALPVQNVFIGTLACLRAGLRASGATEFTVPDSVRMPLEDLRRWSRVLQAGMAAETVIYGSARGGADDRALLGQLWGLSGHDVPTAQREQRRARREIEQQLRTRRSDLEDAVGELLESAPRLGR
ncbi:hypothetical protein [Synechococcus sp. MIT S1220]|uniref:hypothetical protein n=1 Tax=Synechococcus sp. MIT S1220 TaxID=3082549 RepID=UPI0039AF7442